MILSQIDSSGTLTGVILALIVFAFAIKLIINFMRSRADLRKCLPGPLQQSGGFPEWMSSLSFYDRKIKKMKCCKKNDVENVSIEL